jgi:hypothetical protein
MVCRLSFELSAKPQRAPQGGEFLSGLARRISTKLVPRQIYGKIVCQPNLASHAQKKTAPAQRPALRPPQKQGLGG